MLVLSRKYGEELILRCGEHEARVLVRPFHGEQVKLCVTAPAEFEVLRGELSPSEAAPLDQ